MSTGGGEAGGEKSFAASQKKLDDARARGEIAKSTDLTTAATYLGLLLAILLFGEGMATATGAALLPFLAGADALTGRILADGGQWRAAGMLVAALLPLLPLALLPALLATLALIAQGAFVLAGEKLTPKLSRISPVEIAKNRFGPAGLFEFVKSTVKLVAISALLWVELAGEMDAIIGSLRAPVRLLPGELMRLGFDLLITIAAIAGVIGVIDWLWQRAQHARQLRMSFQEVKEEARESEGDPHMKAARRQRAAEIAQNRMLLDVPKADVVVVNPSHYAVALAWSRKPGSAPHCVAKGVDEVARVIRERAMAAGVPLHADAPTARALHALVEIGEEVPPDLYRAVAAAIRFAETMRAKARAGYGPASPAPGRGGA